MTDHDQDRWLALRRFGLGATEVASVRGWASRRPHPSSPGRRDGTGRAEGRTSPSRSTSAPTWDRASSASSGVARGGRSYVGRSPDATRVPPRCRSSRHSTGSTTRAAWSTQARQSTPAARAHHDKGRAVLEAAEKSKESLLKGLPPGVDSDEVLAMLRHIVYNVRDVLVCERTSNLSAIKDALLNGLALNPKLGECYFIPRWNKNIGAKELQMQVGYRGMVKWILQSGLVTKLRAEVVYEKDVFEFWYDPELKFRHIPWCDDDRGRPVLVYSYAKFLNGDIDVERMTFQQVEGIRARSESPTSGPWGTDWEEMAKKTVTRRHAKRLPTSQTYDRRIELVDRGVTIGSGYAALPGSTEAAPASPDAPAQRGVAGLASRLAPPPASETVIHVELPEERPYQSIAGDPDAYEEFEPGSDDEDEAARVGVYSPADDAVAGGSPGN